MLTQWFVYHNVLRIIAVCIIVALVAVFVGLVASEAKPVLRLARALRWVIDRGLWFLFVVAIAALVSVILFWLIYPMTPDYARHECSISAGNAPSSQRWDPETGYHERSTGALDC